MKNPKSYSVWYHRRWCIGRYFSQDKQFLADELQLCDRLLEVDGRNFHGWNHRRFIVGLLDSAEFELLFTEKLLFRNFSNYSAWHNRSMLLESEFKREGGAEAILISLEKEISLVRKAYYTEPSDQSAWMYLLWCYQQVALAGSDLNVFGERQHLEGLLKDDPALIWPKIVLVVLGCEDPEKGRLLSELESDDPLRRNLYAALSRENFPLLINTRQGPALYAAA